MEQAKQYTFRKLFWEGFLYSIVWVVIHVVINTLFQYIFAFAFIKREEEYAPISITLLVVVVLLSWVGSSAAFAKIKPQATFELDFKRFLGVGLLNHILIAGAFIFFIFFADNTEFGEALGGFAKMLFMGLWNFFSNGSSNFIVALASFFPTIIAFILIFVLIIFVAFFFINTFSYIITKPLVDKVIDSQTQEKNLNED